MSIIAVEGIHHGWSLKRVVKTFAEIVMGDFSALNFVPSADRMKKTVYLRLHPTLNPMQVANKLNGKIFGKYKVTAYIPDHVPQLQLKKKLTKVPKKLKHKLKIRDDDNQPIEILKLTYRDILIELQFKYPGLYLLSKKNNHELIKAMSSIVQERILSILDTNQGPIHNCFFLTKTYRQKYPHSADFQMIVNTLHQQEDAAGLPHTVLSEQELSSVLDTQAVLKCLPDPDAEAACNKYSYRFGEKVSKYISDLGTLDDEDLGESDKRLEVRRALKKMAPFIPEMIHQVMLNHFKPVKQMAVKMTIHGEPFLPSKEIMQPFLHKFHASKVFRSKRVFNCIKFDVPSAHFKRIMEADKTILNGAKLIIRPSTLPYLFDKKPGQKTQQAPRIGGPSTRSQTQQFNDSIDVDEDMDENQEEMDEEQEIMDEDQEEMYETEN